MSKAKDKEYIVSQLAYLMRFANRMKNTHPELVNDNIIDIIENSKAIIRDHYNLNQPKIIQSKEIKK